jgi:hypothetical protein
LLKVWPKNTEIDTCPEPALSLMTVMHLFGVSQFTVSSYSHTATPYRSGDGAFKAWVQ